MAIDTVVDSLDAVDEGVRDAYAEKDGKFHLDIDKYVGIQKAGIDKKNKELLGKLAKEKATAKRYEILGEVADDDLAEFTDWLKTRGQNGAGKGKEGEPDPQLAALQKQLDKATSKHTTEKAQLEGQLAALRDENRYFKLTVPLRTAAAKAGVFEEDLDVVMMDTIRRFKLNDEDKIIVLDEDGDETDVTPLKFFETLYKQQRPKFYRNSGAAGSGATPSNGGANGKRTINRSEYDAMIARGEKVDFKTTQVVD